MPRGTCSKAWTRSAARSAATKRADAGRAPGHTRPGAARRAALGDAYAAGHLLEGVDALGRPLGRDECRLGECPGVGRQIRPAGQALQDAADDPEIVVQAANELARRATVQHMLPRNHSRGPRLAPGRGVRISPTTYPSG